MTINPERILKASAGGWFFVVRCPSCGADSLHTWYGPGVACLCGAKYEIAEPAPGWQDLA